MRLVLDTDVIVAALRSPLGASAALLRMIRQSRATMLIGTALLLEYEAVCQRAKHQMAAGLTTAEIEKFLDGLAFLAEPVEMYFHWRPQLKDAGDEMVLETAVNGQARAIVTFNRRGYGSAPGRFGIGLLLPAEVFGRIGV